MPLFSGVQISGGSFNFLIEFPFQQGYMFRITVAKRTGEVLDVIQKRFPPSALQKYGPHLEDALKFIDELFPPPLP